MKNNYRFEYKFKGENSIYTYIGKETIFYKYVAGQTITLISKTVDN